MPAGPPPSKSAGGEHDPPTGALGAFANAHAHPAARVHSHAWRRTPQGRAHSTTTSMRARDRIRTPGGVRHVRAGKARAQINSKRGAGRGSRAAAGESSTAPNGVPCRQGLHRRNPPAASTIPRPARWARSQTLMPTLPRDRIRTPGGVRHVQAETAFARLEACATGETGQRGQRDSRACSRRAFARLEAHATGGRRRNARGCCCRALSRGILSAGDMSRSSSPPRFAPSSTPFSRPRSRRDAAHRHRPTHHPESP